MAKGILFVAFDFAKAHADEFHDWYDLEHVPERQRVPGFLACERWISEDSPTVALATYDLRTVGVLQTPAYMAVGGDNLSVWSKRVTTICDRIMRYEGEQILPGELESPTEAKALLAVSMNVDAAAEHEFNEWYNTEHLPALATVPGVLAARRYHGAGGERKYLSLYSLTSTDVTRSDAWRKAAGTPWTDRLRPHFRDFLRLSCKRYARGS